MLIHFFTFLFFLILIAIIYAFRKDIFGGLLHENVKAVQTNRTINWTPPNNSSISATKYADPELEGLKRKLEGKIFVETLKTKINRHTVFWIGRSSYDDGNLRIGIEFSGGRRYFFDWSDFQSDARCSEYEIMTPQDADELEEKIRKNRKK